MLYLLHEAIAEAAPGAQIVDFCSGTEALSQMRQTGAHPDAVFSDIRMPGLSGLELAVQLKGQSPETKLVFVTGYDYAMDAYRLHVHGYISKPVEAERVREELDYLFPDRQSESNRLTVKCFGDFEVFWQGKPLTFTRRQTKELLAWLIDKKGAESSAEEIVAALWEDEADPRIKKTRLRSLIYDLRQSLAAIGQEELLLRRWGFLAIRADMVDCDYYRMLDGDMAAVNAYRGEYMRQYTWAELTAGTLFFR